MTTPLDELDRAAAYYAPVDTPLGMLTGFSRLVGLLEANIREYVEVAREGGASWTEIGEALGTTKQAAHARFNYARSFKTSEAYVAAARAEGVSEDRIADTLAVPRD